MAATTIEEQQLMQTQQKIAAEKKRIIAAFPKASPAFLNTLDSAILYSGNSVFDTQKQLLYQSRLLNYLSTINNEDKLNSGRYTMGLVFFKTMVNKSENNTFRTFVEEHTGFSMQYIALYADDSIAYKQLQLISKENPDMVLKNFDGYASQSYATEIIENLALYAPEKVKNFFTSNYQIRNIVFNSTKPGNIVLKNIYNTFGYKSKVYWTIEKVLSSEYSLKQADSIGKLQWRLYEDMTEILENPNPIGQYSINEELQYITISHARDYSFGITPHTDIVLAKMDLNQLFVFLVYGYQDLTNPNFDYIFNKFIAKEGLVNQYLLENIRQDAFRHFAKYCESKNLLTQLANKISGENHTQLMAALAETEEEGQEDLPILDSYKNDMLSAVNTTEEKYKELKPTIQTPQKPIETSSEIVSNVKEVEAMPEKKDEAVIPIARFEIDATEKNILSLKKNIFKSMQSIAVWIDEKESKDILLYAAEKEPEEVFKKYDKYKSKFFAAEVVERAAINSPVTVKRYIINPANSINYVLQNSSNDAIKKMIALNEATSFYTKPYLLFNQILQNKITVERAMQIAEDDDLLMRELIATLTSNKAIIGKHDIEKELSYLSLRFVRGINDLLNQPDNIRFKKLDNYSIDELYSIMNYGRQEVLSGTFYGMFDRFNSNLPMRFDNAAVDKFLNHNTFKTFITLCANYNRLDAFLAHFSAEQQKKVLNQFVFGLEKDDEFTEPIMVAEAIINTNSPFVVSVIQDAVKSNYQNFEKTNDYKGLTIYGILSGLIADKVTSDKNWFATMHKMYNVADLSVFSPELLKSNNKIVERVYFYNDEDGRSSFDGFVKNYKNNTNWSIEDNFNYIKISSLNSNRVIMYANKPEFAENGDNAIQKQLRDNQETVSFVVHRGHSFHTENTLEKTNQQTKLVFVGSCGGFYKTFIATRNAPEAQVIASKQWASHTVNEPILFQLNEKIRLNQNIVWRSFWDDMKVRLSGNKLFDDYVPPHKNLESLFVKAFYQILEI